MSEIQLLIDEIVAFRDARDWGQFHTPRHLAAGLSIEVAELMETMLWLSDTEVEAMLSDPSRNQGYRREIADVLIYSLMLCERAGIDPGLAIRDKLAENAEKYPVDISRGRSTKYTDLARPSSD